MEVNEVLGEDGTVVTCGWGGRCGEDGWIGERVAEGKVDEMGVVVG